MNGTITLEILKKYNSQKAYYSDIQEPKKKIKDKRIEFILNTEKEIKTPEKVDLVTCFNVIHHLKDKKIIDSLKKNIKKNGYLLIVDHDVKDKKTFHFLNLVHGLYEYVRGETREWFNNYYARYYSFDQLLNFFKEFEMVSKEDYIRGDKQRRIIVLLKKRTNNF